MKEGYYNNQGNFDYLKTLLNTIEPTLNTLYLQYYSQWQNPRQN